MIKNAFISKMKDRDPRSVRRIERKRETERERERERESLDEGGKILYFRIRKVETMDLVNPLPEM